MASPIALWASIRVGGGQRRRGHDVEIAGIGRQVIGRAFDLEEDRRAYALEVAEPGMRTGWLCADALELHLCFKR